MAASDVRTVTYETDTGESVFIQIKYEENGRNNNRYEDGGFGDENIVGCSSSVGRRRLQPRFILKRYGSGASATVQRVFVKDLDSYAELILEETTVKYCGECYCPNNSN